MRSQQGAPWRAFLSWVDIRLLTALALSVALHAALLPVPMTPGRDVGPPRRDFEVRFGHRSATPTVPTQSLAPSPVGLRSANPTAPNAMTVISPATAVQAKAATAPEPLVVTTSDPAPQGGVTGLAIPQQVSIPISANRSMWSGQTPQQTDAQAAYMAQQQHQARLNQQLQMRTAQAQYDARLMKALGDCPISDSCHVVLSNVGEQRVRCNQTADTASIMSVLKALGRAPQVSEENTWLQIDMTPGSSDVPVQLVSRRVAQDPDR